MTAPRPEVANRPDEFGAGVNSGTPDSADVFNSEVPHHVLPHILDPMLPTGNGEAPGPTGSGRDEVGGGEAPTPNGSADNTYQAHLQMNEKRQALA